MGFPFNMVALLLALLHLVSAENSLMRAWTHTLDSTSGHDTPVTRVVNLLKDMHKTVKSEMDEDEDLYQKLRCWCNDNNWEKGNAIESAEAKISELESTIQSLSGSTAELRASIKELEEQFTADKKSLAEATAVREKQLDDFHNAEKDSIQAIENLKAAITVLSKHHDAPPKSTVDGGAIFKSEKDSWSFLQVLAQDLPSRNERSFFNFMRDSGLDDTLPAGFGHSEPSAVAKTKFLQQESAGSMTLESQWSEDDTAIVKRAMTAASAFVQSRQGAAYYPAYNSQSGEIMGVLKQLKEEMEGDLSDSQSRERDRAAAFAELRAAKTEEIESGEKMAEDKEDQLADQDNELAHSKEDLEKEEATLAADKKFVKNLKETCANAGKNYDSRKNSRMKEMQAISETIEILQGDEARDAMSSTFNFMQVSTKRMSQSEHRRQAARVLRRAANAYNNAQLSELATSAELDAFTKVKKAIDDMIAMLKQQQEDEVKKVDWCKAELQSNEMETAKKQTLQQDLEAKIAKLESDIKALQTGIADAKAEIAATQVDLQKATETRKQENLDFQKTISDQTVTIEVLHKALDRLATYYDLMQTHSSQGRQTPDVPQMKYGKSKGASGVMEMMEKLIYDSRELMTESKAEEAEAQSAYEQLVEDTNDSVAALQKEIVSKTKAKVSAQKDKREAESDLSETVENLEGLAKYNAELHTECDYVVKNFDLRQTARSEEVEALQQAKQILNGASLS